MYSTKNSLEFISGLIPDTEEYAEVKSHFESTVRVIGDVFEKLAQDPSNSWVNDLLEQNIKVTDNALEYLASLVDVFTELSSEYDKRTQDRMNELTQEFNQIKSTLKAHELISGHPVVDARNSLMNTYAVLIRASSRINQAKVNLEKLGFKGVIETNSTEKDLLKNSLNLELAQEANQEVIEQIFEDSNEYMLSSTAAKILNIYPQEMAYIVTSLQLSGDLTDEDYIVREGIRGKYFTPSGLKKLMALLYAKWPERTGELLTTWATMFAGVSVNEEMSKPERRAAQAQIDAQIDELTDMAAHLNIVNNEVQILRAFGKDAYKTVYHLKETNNPAFETKCSVSRLAECFPYLKPTIANKIANYTLIEGEDYIVTDVNAKNSDSKFTTKKNLTLTGMLKLSIALSRYQMGIGFSDGLKYIVAGLPRMTSEKIMAPRAMDILTMVLDTKIESQKETPISEAESFENWVSEMYKDAKDRFFNLLLNDLTVNNGSDENKNDSWILDNKFGNYVDMVAATFGDDYRNYFESSVTDTKFRDALYMALTNAKNTMVNAFNTVIEGDPFATVSQVIKVLREEALQDKRRTFAIDFIDVLVKIEKKFGDFKAVNFVEFGLKKSKNAENRKSEIRDMFNAYPQAPSLSTIVSFRSYLSKRLDYFASTFGLADANTMGFINRNVFGNRLDAREVALGFHKWSIAKTSEAVDANASVTGEVNAESIHNIINYIIKYVQGNESEESFNLWFKNELIPNYRSYTPVLAIVSIVKEAMVKYADNRSYIVDQLNELVENFN